jgi:hypothetical protein
MAKGRRSYGNPRRSSSEKKAAAEFVKSMGDFMAKAKKVAGIEPKKHRLDPPGLDRPDTPMVKCPVCWTEQPEHPGKKYKCKVCEEEWIGEEGLFDG